jgi:hypothetical protein
MPHTIRIDESRRVVVVGVTGAVDVEMAKPMVAAARAAAASRGFDILYDYRGAVPGDIKPADLFWFPRKAPELTEPEARRMRVAALHLPLPAHRELIQFWETAFNNLGLPARAFEDEAEAYSWLAAKPDG